MRISRIPILGFINFWRNTDFVKIPTCVQNDDLSRAFFAGKFLSVTAAMVPSLHELFQMVLLQAFGVSFAVTAPAVTVMMGFGCMLLV